MQESHDDDVAFVRRQLKADPSDNALRHKLGVMKARIGDTTLQDKADKKLERFQRRAVLRTNPGTQTPLDDVRKNLMHGGKGIVAARGGKLSLEKQHPDKETRPENVQKAIDYYAQAKKRYRKVLGHLNKGKRDWLANSHHDLEPDMRKYYQHKAFPDNDLKNAERELKGN